MEQIPENQKQHLRTYRDFLSLLENGDANNVNASKHMSAHEQEAISDLRKRVEKGEISFEIAASLLTGISEEFLQIHNSAKNIESRLNPHTIQDYKRQYQEWTREELLSFVNNPKNVTEFQKRPALVIALEYLLDTRLR